SGPSVSLRFGAARFLKTSGSTERWATVSPPARKKAGTSSGSAFTAACVRIAWPPESHAKAGAPRQSAPASAARITRPTLERRIFKYPEAGGEGMRGWLVGWRITTSPSHQLANPPAYLRVDHVADLRVPHVDGGGAAARRAWLRIHVGEIESAHVV